MSSDAQVLFVPWNESSEKHHGGVRREKQLWDVVSASGFHASRTFAFPIVPAPKVRRALDAMKLCVEETGRIPLSWRSFRTHANASAIHDAYRAVFKLHANLRVLLVENAYYNRALISTAVKDGFKVICFPQNIEGLSLAHCRNEWPLGDLRPLQEEFEVLGKATAVFCISFEEQWLLREFGIDAELLPYYPAAIYRSGFDEIRKSRVNAKKDHLLILGTATHPPTREGMVELIRWLADWPARSHSQIVIAGFGAESLGPLIPPEGFRLAGSVSENDLTDLMKNAKAVIVHQRFGCGALTRIPDLLYAGIPVVANTIAARTYHGYPGIHIYSYPEELYTILDSSLPDPPLPPRPIAAERKIAELFSKWVGEASGFPTA